jgi:C4-dicarboxylate-specific signal transduction histidine kinase
LSKRTEQCFDHGRRDNGVGINPERTEFFNLSLPQKNSGMGLGLGIIKTLLKITKEQLP